MNIYEYLKFDHKKVANLFELYKTAPTAINKIEILAMINKELTIHSISEERTFYKTLEQYNESRNDVLHSEKEHKDIKMLLDELIQMNEVGAKMDTKVLELQEVVEHHVSEEEGKIFDEAKAVLSEEEAYMLKEQMHDLKGRLILDNFSDD